MFIVCSVLLLNILKLLLLFLKENLFFCLTVLSELTEFLLIVLLVYGNIAEPDLFIICSVLLLNILKLLSLFLKANLCYFLLLKVVKAFSPSHWSSSPVNY